MKEIWMHSVDCRPRVVLYTLAVGCRHSDRWSLISSIAAAHAASPAAATFNDRIEFVSNSEPT